ncbi:MAG: cytochrome c maturation protein CcmE [Pseudomonadota bacterium]
MTRKQRRATLIGLAVTVLSVGVILTLFALRDGVVFFYTPSEAQAKGIKPGIDIRLGGLVEKGSVRRDRGTKVEFTITDTKHAIPVVFDGILPDLFREEQGVVAIGKLTADGKFIAASVLAKHDEAYMPPEVAKALKEQGVFKGDKKDKK